MTVNTFDPNASDSCSTTTLGQMLDNQPAKPAQAQPGAARIGFVSLGCPKNLVDSERILTQLRTEGYEVVNRYDNAELVIVNTCGFIGPAKEESLNTIFSLHEARKKGSVLVMAGCLTERYKEDLTQELKEVDLFTGVGDYDKIDEIIALRQNRFTPSTYLLNEEERVITGSNAHAYIKLSEGCNQSCSFCAIPGTAIKNILISREGVTGARQRILRITTR